MTPVDSAASGSRARRPSEWVTRSEEETAAVAREIGARLSPGAVLLLSGNLGAGKTAFVRGLADGLGISAEEVSSPTFTLDPRISRRTSTLYHADLYRLERAATEDLGLEELGVRDGVLAIEWPDRLSHPIDGAIRIDLAIVDESTPKNHVHAAVC